MNEQTPDNASEVEAQESDYQVAGQVADGQADESMMAAIAKGKENKARVDGQLTMRDGATPEAKAALAELRNEPDQIKRAKALGRSGAGAQFPDVSFSRKHNADMAEGTDGNRFAVFDAQWGKDIDSCLDHPYFDTFSRKVRGWSGDVDGDKTTAKRRAKHLVLLAQAHGLKGQSAKSMNDAFDVWMVDFQRDSLIQSFTARLPEWDGIERASGFFLNGFGAADEPVMEQASAYFFRSVYNRIMSPGCMAPVTLHLVGSQKCGKSYFYKKICEMVMNDKMASPVSFDPSASLNDFRRVITGRAVIAVMGELAGYGSSDLSKIKEEQTRTSYSYDEKFQGTDTIPVRYVIAADANDDVGILRDETGDRRNFIAYVNQLPDVDGRRKWAGEGSKAPYLSDLDQFESDFWQIMSECRAWFAGNQQTGWRTFVDEFSDNVSIRSREFMNSGNATIRDSALDLHLNAAILECEIKAGSTKPRRDSENSVARPFVQILERELTIEIAKLNRSGVHNRNRLERRMIALGATHGKFCNGLSTYRFYDVANPSELFDLIHGVKRDADGNEISDVVMGLTYKPF